MSDANLWNFMCNCVLKFYFQATFDCARSFLLFRLGYADFAEVNISRQKHLKLIFCQWHLTNRPHTNAGISVELRMLLKCNNRVHMVWFWLIDDASSTICMCSVHIVSALTYQPKMIFLSLFLCYHKSYPNYNFRTQNAIQEISLSLWLCPLQWDFSMYYRYMFRQCLYYLRSLFYLK